MHKSLQQVLEECRVAVSARSVALIGLDGDVLAVAGELDGVTVTAEGITTARICDLTFVGVFDEGGVKLGELIAMGPGTDDTNIQAWAKQIGEAMAEAAQATTTPSHDPGPSRWDE